MDICLDLVPLQDDVDDQKIMGLIENLRHDDERASALATLVASYTEKLAEVAAAATQKGGKGKGKAPAPKLSAHQRHVRTLMRLSVQCPFESIRDAVTPLVQRLKACDAFTIPQSTTAAFPSVYLAPSDIPSMTECAEAAEAEFIEAFRADGRVSHMTQVMACHPEYLARFREVHNWMLWDEGPLPLPERQLIAVMACGRHNCRYLAEIHTKHFLDLGGDRKWLKGAAHLPPKLRKLIKINAVLAHQPWRLTVDDIAELVKSGVDSWSLTELVQALSILIHFHALQSFVLGCGITIESDLNDTKGAPAADDCSDAGGDSGSAEADPSGCKSVFVEVRDKLRAEDTVDADDDDEAANLQEFADAETEEALSQQEQQAITPTLGQWFPLYECSLLSAGAACIPGHEDFDIKSKEYTIFRTQDFSWADQCYSTLSRYCPEIAELVDAEFSSITQLTYETIGDEVGINTFKFRWAIWNYTLRTQGVVNDEYMYRNVNKWLPREVKSLVKTNVCYPQLSTKVQWVKVDNIKDSERVHINLLSMCARKQAVFLYAMNAVSQFVTSRE